MIILELSSKSPRLPNIIYGKFEVIDKEYIIALLLKNCVDEWVYHVDCARTILKSSYDEYLQIFKDIIKENADNLLSAILTSSPGEYLKDVVSLHEENIKADLYAIYLSKEGTLQSKLSKKIIPFIVGRKIAIWDASIPIELKMNEIKLEEVADSLERISFNITRGYLHEGDLLAVRVNKMF